MSPTTSTTTLDDDPELPPPSAQQHRLSCPSPGALGPRNSPRAAPVPSGLPRRRRDLTVSNGSGVSSRDAVNHNPRASSTTMHRRHTPPSSTNPSSDLAAASAKHSPRPSSSAHPNPPPLLTSGVASAARVFFDPWNSSSTGHQRAENRLSGSTSWRLSRSRKLEEQYKGGLGGGKRVADTVGAGSEAFGKDGRLPNGGWEKGASGLRTGGQKSLAEVWGKSKAATTARRSSQEEKKKKYIEDDALQPELLSGAEETDLHINAHDNANPGSPSQSQSQHLDKPPEKQIFRNLCFYINGSTMPLISDHKLKYVLHAHGASQSIALGRRTVTHVILGTTCGGGLAASKIQKEIARTRGNAVRYVTVEWVLESIAANKRLPESRFSPLKLASSAQASVRDALTLTSSKPSSPSLLQRPAG